MKKGNGFTFLELLIVVTIFGILAIIIIPKFNKHAKAVRVSFAQSFLEKYDVSIDPNTAQCKRHISITDPNNPEVQLTSCDTNGDWTFDSINLTKVPADDEINQCRGFLVEMYECALEESKVKVEGDDKDGT